MSSTLLMLGGGGVLLYFAAGWLVNGAAAIARRLHLPPVAIGLTVVAFGTSMPELAVSIDGALDGQGGLVVGNVVGSNICNIGLILALAAFIRPLRPEARLARIDMPIVTLCSIMIVLAFRDGQMSRLDGLLALAGITLWVALILRQAPDDDAVELPPTGAMPKSLLLVTAGLAGLAGGAELFVRGAVDLATLFHVTPAIIGLSIVAIGTSLPELATSAVAAARGHGGMAVGNVVGSNIFNLLGILGVTSLIRPFDRGDVSSVDFGVMIAFAVVLLLMLALRTGLGRISGATLLGGYLAYMAWLINSGGTA